MKSGPGASRPGATRAASLAALLGLSGCAGAPVRDAEHAHRQLVRAISRGDAEAVSRRVHPALGSPEALLETGQALELEEDELAAVHPVFADWTHEAMVNVRVTIPFHEGAQRWLQEVGAWSPGHEETHERLLSDLTP